MYPYQDRALSTDERLADLLPRMSLEEKFAQLRLVRFPSKKAKEDPFDLSILEENKHRCGAFYNNYSMSAENLNRIQEWYIAHNRWGIPLAIHGESIHGVLADNATVFPQAIGLGAAFNRELMTEIVTQIGKEARANGTTMTYAPDLDLSRDPRWGRTEENYGEDPYLTSELGVAYVKALQEQGVASCVKHFIAHGSPESGINLGPVHAGEREFRETLMVPFQKAIMEGKAMAVMPAYSELDGEAVHASRRLLTDLLRGEFGFDGQVISDYAAINMLHSFHRVAKDAKEAGQMALQAGVDLEAPDVFGFGPELEEAVRKGEVAEELVDQAVSRILRHKFDMGIFDHPYIDPEASRENRNDDALSLTRKAAGETVVLLKNQDQLLPLSDKIGKIALIGPNADNPQLGDYTAKAALERTITLKRALVERLGAERIAFAKGCTIAGGTEEMLDEAIACAKSADAVVLVLGDNSNFFGGVGWGDPDDDGNVAVTCGEGFDVNSLDLPGRQQLLLEEIYKTGKPVILILETGRPYAVCWAKEHIPAILQAWYPGEQGGYALADILFGDVNPSGRLPISFPRSVGHIPAFYNHKNSAKGYYKKPGSKEHSGRDYVFDTPDALFAFGEGLSYTTFAYSDLAVSSKHVDTSSDHVTVSTGYVADADKHTGIQDAVEITVTVTNTGARAGYEVVQLYVTDEYCRITPFVKRLRGFEKIWLEPGQQKQVSFVLGFEDFAFINEAMKQEVEPGDFIIRVGDQELRITLES